jgi:hypothetical protein
LLKKLVKLVEIINSFSHIHVQVIKLIIALLIQRIIARLIRLRIALLSHVEKRRAGQSRSSVEFSAE